MAALGLNGGGPGVLGALGMGVREERAEARDGGSVDGGGEVGGVRSGGESALISRSDSVGVGGEDPSADSEPETSMLYNLSNVILI